ncbi:hypothetical protein [Fluoribacter gormanii]|uniref:hypothetical protein n=1 Tax=Fluoribacter gormanii TaxID=464 RepID=UPI0013EFC1ED|nr:hypothetical protein [Fluoribacter gormanii]
MERKSYRSDLTNKQWQLIVQNMVILNYAKNFWTEPGSLYSLVEGTYNSPGYRISNLMRAIIVVFFNEAIELFLLL